ncbi:hypothetical protein CSIM01_11347 [Colletotrichum simmondsii]|uniref:Uncharacterized protein n=1 Tax=Colletotrichum simmondsii TaxID=703756 RepID=A0A135THP0_9PEZI|nr:hypothetical protein CSIM01_11347 [Colletotrichum simmondsii]
MAVNSGINAMLSSDEALSVVKRMFRWPPIELLTEATHWLQKLQTKERQPMGDSAVAEGQLRNRISQVILKQTIPRHRSTSVPCLTWPWQVEHRVVLALARRSAWRRSATSKEGVRTESAALVDQKRTELHPASELRRAGVGGASDPLSLPSHRYPTPNLSHMADRLPYRSGGAV